MVKMKKENQNFHRNCGEILRMGLSVETAIEFFISNYFCSPQSYKTFLFEDLILIKLNFERKINIFKYICKEEGIDQERLNKIIDAVRHVQKIRNRVAHDEAYVHNQEEGIVIQKRKRVQYKKDELTITDELVNEVNVKRLFAIQEISKIHMELSESSRKNYIDW
jgi:hypothetical protein